MEQLDFDWLRDLNKSQCYTTCDWTNPAKSSDFGDNGHTASLTDWHELLQLTAPDAHCGIVFVRGDFPNTADAILARAQRRDDADRKGTFGVRILPDSDIVLGEGTAQGLVNFRWPYVQYELKRKPSDGDTEEINSCGSYEEISFVKDRTVVQIIRLKLGRFERTSRENPTKSKGQAAEHPGNRAADDEDPKRDDSAKEQRINFKIGGRIQFGCLCSTPSTLDEDHFTTLSLDDGFRLGCVSHRYEKRLEMQLFINNEPKRITSASRRDETHGRMVDASASQEIPLWPGKPAIIVSTYALRSSSGLEPLFNTASFVDFENYLGIATDSVNMTDRLWSACLTTNYDASEAVETCTIAMSVEQTLCVSSVPIPPTSPSLLPRGSRSSKEIASDSAKGTVTHVNDGFSNEPIENDMKEECSIAYVRNIMTAQYVDLQSTFWQVRLLVKVHQFLRTRHFQPDLLETVRPLKDIRTFYLQSLRSHIRSVMVWILKAKLETSKILLPINADEELDSTTRQTRSQRLQHCSDLRESIKLDSSYNQACFVTMIIWYVMKHCPQALTPDFKSRFLLKKLKQLYELGEKQDSWGDKDSHPKNDVLQWFHLSCLLLICQQSFIQDTDGKDIDGYVASGLNRQAIVKAQERSKKAITRLRKSKTQPYSMEDEEVDRLFLMGEELGLESLPSLTSWSLVVARADQTRSRIVDRKFTTMFNPGPKVSKLGRSSRIISNGPWELACLNHHSLLRTTLDGSSEVNVRASRDTCFEFLLSDYTFMTSWDRADNGMLGSWWNFEPGSVIGATLVDLKTEAKLKCAEPDLTLQGLSRSKTDIAMSTVEEKGATNLPAENQRDLFQRESLREIVSLLKQDLVQNEAGFGPSSRAFDWIGCKPGKIYHPKDWMEATDHTLEAPKTKQTKDVPFCREIAKYFSGEDDKISHNPLEWHMERVEKIDSKHLEFLSLFDFFLNDDFTFRLKENSFQKFQEAISGNAEDVASGLQSSLQEHLVFQRRMILVSHRVDILAALNKNVITPFGFCLKWIMADREKLVDRGTRYRILFAQRCCPPTVKAFICKWHPHAESTFDNYFGRVSCFADTREAMWITTITIAHWGFRPSELSGEQLEMFKEGRSNGRFPPESIANLDAENANEKTRTIRPFEILEERSSSLVFTGDSHGYFWVCSIWSSLTNSGSLKLRLDTLPSVLQLFIHQQASGRCLVFLILLGHLCENLAREHEIMLFQLITIVELGDKVLLVGFDWEAENAVEKLKKMIWGLEALRVFDDSLSSSLSQIRDARTILERTIEQESGQQHIELIQEYKNVLDEFGKRYGILAGVQLRIQLRIRQATGLMEGISTVTNVLDNRTALDDSATTIKQGNNIKVLTLVTIAYLPLGFVTGLFSVSRGVLPDDAGATLYAILVVSCMIITYGIALFLQAIDGFFRQQWNNLKKKLWRSDSESSKTSRTSGTPKRGLAKPALRVAGIDISGLPAKHRKLFGFGMADGDVEERELEEREHRLYIDGVV